MGSGATRSSVGAAVAVLVGVLLVASPPARAADLRARSPEPVPADLVMAGAATIALLVEHTATITSARVRLDGVDVLPVRVTPVDGGSRVAADADLAAGEHAARVEVEFADGTTVDRSWSFASTSVAVERLAGRSRTETATAVSRARYPAAASASSAVVARADGFADALAGAPLAVHLDGPLLLSATDRLSADAEEELSRVLEEGATVHLLGGDGALSAQVESDVEALGFTAVRHAGPDRYATAAAVAAQLPASGTVFVASGATFPDALAASVPAARDGIAVLLTDPDTLPAATADALDGGEVASATIVGGPGAVGVTVEDALRERGVEVTRIAGGNRFATAVAIADAHFGASPPGIAIASGDTFPDALAGTVHAAAAGYPLLLTSPRALNAETVDAIAAREPVALAVYGGPGAVAEDVAANLRRAAHHGPGPRVTSSTPASGATTTWLPELRLSLSAPIEGVVVHATLDGVEFGPSDVAGAVARSDATSVAVDVLAAFRALPVEAPGELRVTLHGTDGDGRHVRHVVTSTLVRPDPVWATTSGVDLHLPSEDVQLIGYHESNHDGAQAQVDRATSTTRVVMESRGRGNHPQSAADIVANPDLPVFAPVTGEVKRAGSYRLYCDHTDHYLVISPDAQPSWEVKVLHFEGLSVSAGDRVEAGVTQVGTRPRTLPFRSQVDDVSDARDWPHLHLEVVDPDVPDRPGSGC